MPVHLWKRTVLFSCGFKHFTGKMKLGHKLWEFQSGQTLKHIKKQLRMLGYVKFEDFTWKSFRAGRATEMADDGYSLEQIVLAGEWRSVAFLRHLDVEKVNPCRLLGTTVDESD